MKPGRPAPRLDHSALLPSGGEALERAGLTDRQRVAVVFEGAALLSHLANVGYRLVDGWQSAVVSESGHLRVLSVADGRCRELPQSLLSTLVSELFASGDRVSGRGQARRAVRTLLDGWQQRLEPLSADQAVGQVLAAAPFLWRDAFTETRMTLAAYHLESGKRQLWVAGPPGCRARIRAALRAGEPPSEVFSSQRFRQLWCDECESTDPLRLGAEGRLTAAIAVWEQRAPENGRERFGFAQALFSEGRFERALEVLRGQNSPADRVLRLACQYHLGRLGAAKASLRRLREVELDTSLTHEAADVAVRVLANAGEAKALQEWVSRALAVGRGRSRLRGRMIAAAAAWDCGNAGAMDDQLAAAGAAASDDELSWRYHQLRALQAIAAADGAAAVRAMQRALGHGGRRSLRRVEVGRLWNDMALARIVADDLPAAERACRHSLRLLRQCDGPAQTPLALYNLAEVRIRRGRLSGVHDILERSSRENRLSGNVRGGAQDAELWARYELVRGDAESALAHCQSALETIAGETDDWNRAELKVFAARALGWLRRPSEASLELEGTSKRSRSQLEPEERPALWALAGELDRARTAGDTGAFSPLWSRVLRDEEPCPEDWQLLGRLEPYRAARLVLDIEQIRPASVPPTWLQRAIDTFRRTGAAGHADRLTAMTAGPWLALDRYLAKPKRDRAAIRELLDGAGHGEAAVRWQSTRGEGSEVEITAAAGGPEELSAPAGGGRLILIAPRLDVTLRVLFAVVLGDWPSWLRDEENAAIASDRDKGNMSRAAGLIGECPAFRQALRRIATLAPRSVPILVLGETGTGKELVARQIHRASARRGATFLPVNCAAVSDTLVLSDLFGHVRGAFTGADRDREGVFETARGGTVFLDEIGDLPPAAQGMLLRVLQEGEVRRLGESRTRNVDVRVVTATHRDLPAMVHEGRFRQDLYYRLKVATVTLPPLCERGDDLWLLTEHLLGELSETRGDGLRWKLSAAARSRFTAHSWPGNVRELKSELEVASAMAAADGSDVIEPDHLGLPEGGTAALAPYHEQVEAFRRRLVEQALADCGSNRAAAARRLGLSRQALSYLVRQLGLI